MNFKLLSKTESVNILLAILIATFVVFPNIIKLFDEQHPHNQKQIFENQPPEQKPPDFDRPPPPDFDGPPPDSEKKTPDAGNNKAKVDKKLVIDFFYFFLLSWILLLINNPRTSKKEVAFIKIPRRYLLLRLISITLLLCILGIYFYSFLYTFIYGSQKPFPWYLDGILISKGLFIGLSTILFSQLSFMLKKQQIFEIENEKLKTESLQNRFDALAAQISPHFFFNSLNSLSGLIRENENKKALKYINQISHIFRYILQGNWQELVPLKEEILFLHAYQYLLTIRYDDKLVFKVDVKDNIQNDCQLPALSLQPLIENIIKHNTISSEFKMEIKIFVKNNDTLVIANKIQLKNESEFNTGIGLSNLSNRYKLLTGKDIKSFIENGIFNVELPLICSWEKK